MIVLDSFASKLGRNYREVPHTKSKTGITKELRDIKNNVLTIGDNRVLEVFFHSPRTECLVMAYAFEIV